VAYHQQLHVSGLEEREDFDVDAVLLGVRRREGRGCLLGVRSGEGRERD
jgi:hypothetical protein